MKKTILTSLVAIISLTTNAQTTTGNVSTNTTVQGLNTTIKSTYNTNIRGALINVGAVGGKDVTTIAGHNTEVKTTYTSLNSAQTFVNGEKTVFNQQGTNTTINKTGISTAGTITGAKMYTQGLDVGNELINLKDAVSLKASTSSVTNLTNRVTATESNITNLQNTKADKTQLDALDNKVNTEVSRLDGRIDATNTRVDNLDNRVTTEVNRLDNEIVKTNNVVEANRITAANATAQVQTNLNTQVTRLDGRIDATNHNVSVLRSEVEANHKKAMDADEQIRTDLRTENQRALRAEQALGDRVDGLGATMMAFGSMASSAVFDPKKRGNMSFGVGTYQKSVAYAVGVSYYTTPNTRVSLNFAGGNNSKLGAGVGASFGF
jgi:hypothetical protein